MKVNGVSVSTCNAKWHSITPGKRSITNDSIDLDGGGTLLLPPAFSTKEYTIKLIVKGNDREDIWQNAGKIMQMFKSVVDVDILSMPERRFKLSLKSSSVMEVGAKKDRWHALTLTCIGYEYGTEMSADILIEFTGTTNEQTVTKELLFADIPRNYNGVAMADTQAVVPTNVTIMQILKCTDPGELHASLAGKEYLFNSTVEITGLCKNSAGMDVGKLTTQGMPAPMYAGCGASAFTINGITGALSVDKWSTNTGVNPSYDAPCWLHVGYPGQVIKIKASSSQLLTIPQKLMICISYVPVYL